VEHDRREHGVDVGLRRPRIDRAEPHHARALQRRRGQRRSALGLQRTRDREVVVGLVREITLLVAMRNGNPAVPPMIAALERAAGTVAGSPN